MKAKFPCEVKLRLPFKTDQKIRALAKEKNIPMAQVAREIIENYFKSSGAYKKDK